MMLFAALFALALLAVVTAWCFRSLGFPGHRIIAGLLIGVLVGPSVLGRILPAPWEAIWIGGAEARVALEKADREHAAWQFAAQASPIAPEQVAEASQAHTLERQPLVNALVAIRSDHQRPWQVAVLGLALAALLAGIVVPPRIGPAPPRRGGIAVGCWAGVLPAIGIWLLATAQGLERFAPATLLLTATVAVGPWAIDARERRIGKHSGGLSHRMLTTAARSATMLAVGLLAAAAMQEPTDWVPWCIAAIVALGVVRIHVAPSTHRRLRRLRDHVLLPILSALAVVLTDVVQAAAFWPILGLAVFAGDGRWLGATIGLVLRGGGNIRTAMCGGLAAVDVGPAQLVIVALGCSLGVLNGTWTTACLAGVLAIEITGPFRRSLHRTMEEPLN